MAPRGLGIRQRFGRSELPSSFWYLWLGTIVNRVGGFAAPFFMLYLTSRLGMAVASAALLVSLLGAGSFLAQLTANYLVGLALAHWFPVLDPHVQHGVSDAAGHRWRARDRPTGKPQRARLRAAPWRLAPGWRRA